MNPSFEQTPTVTEVLAITQGEMPSERPMVEYALEYARRGWRVLPLHTPTASGVCSCNKGECKSVGKHPRTMNGVKDATTDEATIRRWWELQWPNANIGIATGAESGLVVLDVDPRHGGDKSLAALKLENGPLPATTQAETGGGGLHILFEHPGELVRGFSSPAAKPGKLGAGVDVKADGGYIVAPPSLHASKRLYSWGRDANPAPLPGWLLGRLTERKPARVSKGKSVTRPAGATGFPSWEELNGELGRRIADHPSAKLNGRGIYDCAGVCHGSTDGSALMHNPETGATKCNAGCSHAEVLSAFGLPTQPDGLNSGQPSVTNVWGDLGEFLDTDFPAIEEVFKYVERGTVAQFAAATSVGKTTLLLNASLALAAGQPFPPLIPEAGRPRRVLYVDFETTRQKMKESISKMLSREPYDWPRERALVRHNFRPLVDTEINDVPLNLSDPEHLKYVQEQALDFGAELIVIDNGSAGFELTSENDNAEVASRVMLPLKTLARRTNAAVILVHHTGKPGESPRQTIDAFMGRGASAFGSLARSIYGLVPASDMGEGYVVLHNTKNKSGPKLEPVTMRLDFHSLWFEQLNTRPRMDVTAQAVREFVNSRGAASLSEIKEHFMQYGASTRTIERRIADAAEVGLIWRKNQKAKYTAVSDDLGANLEGVIDNTCYPTC